MKYNKLVRDNIPEIIKNLAPTTHIANDNEFYQKLKEKLIEEVNEFINSDNFEEIADILEVIDSIIDYKKFNKQEILTIKKDKKIKRGGFDKRIILDSTIN
jgi:predicted house-cleaning noncanonical NTP pyrophosphatase (MazG superfamily)